MSVTPRDHLMVPIQIGDKVIVSAYGWNVRKSDVGKSSHVSGFTARGNVELVADDIGGGKPVRAECLGVVNRETGHGWEGNRSKAPAEDAATYDPDWNVTARKSMHLAMRIAPNGRVRYAIIEIFNRMHGDGLPNRDITLAMVRIIEDGMTKGNWPSI